MSKLGLCKVLEVESNTGQHDHTDDQGASPQFPVEDRGTLERGRVGEGCDGGQVPQQILWYGQGDTSITGFGR